MDHQSSFSFRRSSSDGRGQPSRIQTFFRQNQNNKPKRILLSLFYAIVASIYLYYLLSIDVGSGVDVRRKVDNTIQEATAPIYKSDSKDPIKLQPRSLADVTIANVEVAWKNYNDVLEMMRRQEMKKEERRKKKMELLKEREEEANRNLATENQQADAAFAADKSATILDSGNQTVLLKEASLNETTAARLNKTAADLEYIQKLTSLQVNRTPTQRNRTKKSSSNKNDDGVGGFLPFFMMIWLCSTCRLFISRFMILSASSRRSRDSADDDDDDEDIDRDASILVAMGAGRDAMQLRRRLRSARANRRFQRFVDRLNAERVENGERQISAETLRHLVNDRDFTGNDYDQLHSFADENGPAIGSWFSQVGATDAEINRCPSRTLSAGDELLRPKRSQESGREETQTCSVCLETYREGETVRTIPCFHTFHAKCIDPWLAEKAECPICKYSAIG